MVPPHQQSSVIRMPTVQLIGAQKAATSSVADWLFEKGGFCRPHVFHGEPAYYSKEVHFFDDFDRFRQGVEFYGKRFAENNGMEGKYLDRTMDATPDTLAFPERVRDAYDKAGGNQVNTVKIIVILREPASRELSLFNHLAYDCRHLPKNELTAWHKQVMNDDNIIMSFDEFVKTRSIPALRRSSGLGRSTRHSLYAVHLRRWCEHFNRQQILILSYDELISHPENIQVRIQQFLGFEIPGKLEPSNTRESDDKVYDPSPETKRILHASFAQHNRELYELLDSNPGPLMEQRPFPKFKEVA